MDGGGRFIESWPTAKRWQRLGEDASRNDQVLLGAPEQNMVPLTFPLPIEIWFSFFLRNAHEKERNAEAKKRVTNHTPRRVKFRRRMLARHVSKLLLFAAAPREPTGLVALISSWPVVRPCVIFPGAILCAI